MSNPRGSPLSPDIKECIVCVKQYFDLNKKSFGIKDTSYEMTADALNIGEATVRRVLADYRKNPSNIYKTPSSRGKPQYAINDSYQKSVREYIRQANSKGEYITLRTIREYLTKDCSIEESFHDATLARALDRWGFEFGKGIRTQHLKEKGSVIAARRQYLRQMRDNRLPNGDTVRPEVYLDETYVNKNHSNDFIWYYWLNDNKIPFSRDCIKDELVELLKKFAPEPTYAIDHIAKSSGHKVIRTPPYHPELQPIELCWGVLKNAVGRNCDFSMKNLEKQLAQAFAKVTPSTCKKVIRKVKDVEDEFWKSENELEEKAEN